MNHSLSQTRSRCYEDASPEVKAIYDDTKRTLQLPFILNWFKYQRDNELFLKVNWSKVKNTLMEGQVPNVLKQCIGDQDRQRIIGNA